MKNVTSLACKWQSTGCLLVRFPTGQLLLWHQAGLQQSTRRVQELGTWPSDLSPGNHRTITWASQHEAEICSHCSFSLLCMILHLIYNCCRPHHMLHHEKWTIISYREINSKYTYQMLLSNKALVFTHFLFHTQVWSQMLRDQRNLWNGE